jgi:hypothetical protein
MKRLYVINEAAGWENRGDVNYLVHGGEFIRQTGPTSFDIVKNVEMFDAGFDGYDFQSLCVDISDSWIDAEAVKSCCDCDGTDEARFAGDCVWYYGAENFGCYGEDIQSIDEIERSLVAAGVLVAKYPQRKRRRGLS